MNVIVDVEEKLEQLSRAASTVNTSGGGGTSSTSATSNGESKTHKSSSQW